MNDFSRIEREQPVGSQTEGAGAAGEGPSSAAPPRLTAVPVRAMEDMLKARTEQIVTHGHTPQADLALPMSHFSAQLRRRAIDVVEDISCNQSRDVLRRRLVKLGALTMAMIDRLDAEEEERSRPL